MRYIRNFTSIAIISFLLLSCGEAQQDSAAGETANAIEITKADDIENENLADGSFMADDISQYWILALDVPAGVETAITSEGVNLSYSANTDPEITDGYHVDIEVEDDETLEVFLDEETDANHKLTDITLGELKAKSFEALAEIGPGMVQHYVYQLGSGNTATLVNISVTTYGDKQQEYKQQALDIISSLRWSPKK